jgi:hypothetical protein
MQTPTSITTQSPHDKEIAKNDRSDTKAKAYRKWYCKVCDVECTSTSKLDRHNTTPRHLNNVRKAKAGIVDKFRCKVCTLSFTQQLDLDRHKKSQRHQDKDAKAKSSSHSP